jgi:predicted amino acid racemase
MAQRDLKALSDVAEGISKKQDIPLSVLFTHLLQGIGITFRYER